VRRQLGWLLWLATACNELYGLEETRVRPPTPADVDTDRDGIADDRDLCPGVADPAQDDLDGDGFGDACDHCPKVATTENHDEDGDSHGDACDLCPSDPDFQKDGDGDGVGDLCDNDFATQNRLLLFDPFFEVGDGWEQTGVWSSFGDAVTGAPGSRLQWPAAVLDETRSYWLDVGVTFVSQLDRGDQFGLELVAGDGRVVASCLVTCDAACTLDLVPSESLGPVFAAVPVTILAMRKNPFRLACVLDGTIATDEQAMTPPVLPPATVRLVGSPKVRFRYVSIWQ
jgi:Thrombospondin type 3 repeat